MNKDITHLNGEDIRLLIVTHEAQFTDQFNQNKKNHLLNHLVYGGISGSPYTENYHFHLASSMYEQLCCTFMEAVELTQYVFFQFKPPIKILFENTSNKLGSVFFMQHLLVRKQT